MIKEKRMNRQQRIKVGKDREKINVNESKMKIGRREELGRRMNKGNFRK